MKYMILGLLMAMVRTGKAVEVGQAAPAFEADSTGGKVKLSDYSGKWLVLYFYPKSFTGGCTKEACSLRDGYAGLDELDAVVLGCSFDSIEDQKRFKEEQRLPFELISDTNRAVATAYGSVANLLPVPSRKTFIIGPDGILAHIFNKVDVAAHAADVSAVLQKLQEPDSKSPQTAP